MKRPKQTIELSPKQAYLLWRASISAKIKVPAVLKYKLYGMFTLEERHKFGKVLGEE